MLQKPKYRDDTRTVVQNVFGGFNRHVSASDGDIALLCNTTSNAYPTLSSRDARYKHLWGCEIMEHFNSLFEGSMSAIEQSGQSVSDGYREFWTPIFVGAYDVSDTVIYLVLASNFATAKKDMMPMLYAASSASCISEGVAVPFSAAYEQDGERRAKQFKAVAYNGRLVVFTSYQREQTCFYLEDKSIKSKTLELVLPKEKTKMLVRHEQSGQSTFICLLCEGEDAENVFLLRESDTYRFTSDGSEIWVKVLEKEELYHSDDGRAAMLLLTTYYNGALVQNCDEEEALRTYESVSANGKNVLVERVFPTVEGVCANNDRIFAVSGNEIYCCASLDEYNWFDYDYTSVSRSFYAKIPSVKRFVSVVSYLGSVYLFTAEEIYKLWGSTPDAFSLSSVGGIGVGAEAANSFGIADSRLFYVSARGPAFFDTDSTTLVSDVFGAWRDPLPTIGCADGIKYYFSDGMDLYVYDTRYGVWHVESMPREHGKIKNMLCIGGNMIFVYSDGYAESIEKSDSTERAERVVSSVEFADICEGLERSLVPVEFTMRLLLAGGASFHLYIVYGSYDSETQTGESESELIYETSREGKHVHVVRFSPRRRCESYRLRINAEGGWRLYSLTRRYQISTNENWGG